MPHVLKSIKKLLLVFLLTSDTYLTSDAFAGDSNPSFTYQGRFLNAEGTETLNEVVDIVLGIYDPSGACLLYEEIHEGIDLSSTQGVVSLSVGSLTGSTSRSPRDPGLPMAKVFANISGQIRPANSKECNGGYSPQSTEGRKLRVSVT